MNRPAPRLGPFQRLTQHVANSLNWLATFLQSQFEVFTVKIPSASTLVRVGAGSGSGSGSGSSVGTICATGHTLGGSGGAEGPNQVYAKVYLPTDAVPNSPIDPNTSQLLAGVVQGVVSTATIGDWRFIRETGGANNEIPGAVCQASPLTNNNKVAVWCLFSTGWSFPEIVKFKGICSTMTSCEAASGSGSGMRQLPFGVTTQAARTHGEQVVLRHEQPSIEGAVRATSVADPGRVRHLIYHVYPHAAEGGRIWRWNIEHLKRRIGLFNGRRVVAVATGPETEPSGAVRDALADCGCDFIEVANDPELKEAVTFPSLLEAVSSFTGAEHATFYGHAKGVTSQAWAPGSRTWTEALYETCLDYWPEVRRLLVDHPLAGPFKRNNCGFPDSRAAWHYSGSFRWMRNADLFARNWREIDRAWTASESHPGVHFASDEAACLVGEFGNDGLGLYLKETWDVWATEVMASWRERHHAERWQPLLMTCILTSHYKPRFVHEAIASVLAQSSPDWQLIIVDSGPLIDAGEFDRYRHDPRIVVVPSGETPDMRGQVGLQARAINEVTRRGLIRGDLVCYLCDDDVYHPGAFAAFLAAARSAPWERAWYGAVDRTEVRSDGMEAKLGELPADAIGGAAGFSLDGRVDGMQVCHRRALLPQVPWPEGSDVAWHADGVFMDQLGKVTAIHPIGAKLGRHRHTGDSTFTRASDASRVALNRLQSP